MSDPYDWTDEEAAPYRILAAQYRLARRRKDYQEADRIKRLLDEAGVEPMEGGIVLNPFRESAAHRIRRIERRLEREAFAAQDNLIKEALC